MLHFTGILDIASDRLNDRSRNTLTNRIKFTIYFINFKFLTAGNFEISTAGR